MQVRLINQRSETVIYIYITMRHIFYSIFLCTVILITISCKQKNRQEDIQDKESKETVVDKRIDTITALYYNYKFASTTPVNRKDITKNIPDFTKESKGVIDATISDTAKIRKIGDEIGLLRKSEKNGVPDTRISVTIKHKDGTTDYLDLCGEYADQIFYNNIQQENNNKLVFYIKNYIGYYPWFIGDDLFSMSELNDTSFPKEPFGSSKYYQEYQAALASR